MQDKAKNQTEIVSEQKEDQSFSENRRKLAKAGIAAPVLLAIANRPAWAGGCAPSAFFSNTHTSSHPEEECKPQGYSPGYWGTNIYHPRNPHSWPAGENPIRPDSLANSSAPGAYKAGGNWYVPDGTKFLEIFTHPTVSPNITMLQVLWQLNGTGTGNIEFHAVAAILNARSLYPTHYSVSPEKVIEIFNSLFQFGYWESSGIRMEWNTGEFQLQQFFDWYVSH